jgi:hypothetical protein
MGTSLVSTFVDNRTVVALANFGGVLGLIVATVTFAVWLTRFLRNVAKTSLKSAISKYRKSVYRKARHCAFDAIFTIVFATQQISWSIFYVVAVIMTAFSATLSRMQLNIPNKPQDHELYLRFVSPASMMAATAALLIIILQTLVVMRLTWKLRARWLYRGKIPW